MNQKILKSILENEKLVVPLVFTKNQLSVIKKIYEQKPLTNAEKKAYYSSIKTKLIALTQLIKQNKEKEYFVQGHKHIIKERLGKAKQIIKSFKHEKIFIAGSFLFSEKFNDIDIFILRKKGYKEEWKDNLHIIYLTEKKLSDPVFQAASLISISTFPIPNNIKHKRLKLNEMMSLYHESVIEHIQKKEKTESIRDLVFYNNLLAKKKLLNAIELNKIITKTSLPDIDGMSKQLMQKLFSKSYLYVDIHEYLKTLNKTIQNTKPNHHLVRYKNTYEELINECRPSKAKIA